jgi:hypothetical protein
VPFFPVPLLPPTIPEIGGNWVQAVTPLILGVLNYLGVACAFRFLGEGGISEAKLWSNIPEKMKIGGIFSDLLTLEMKKGVYFWRCMPEIGGTLRNWVQAVAPLNPGSAQVLRGGVRVPISRGRGYFWSKTMVYIKSPRKVKIGGIFSVFLKMHGGGYFEKLGTSSAPPP